MPAGVVAEVHAQERRFALCRSHLTLAPATLPSGAVGTAYRQQITATGGTGSPVFTILSGALPAALTLSSDGLLTGTPTATGSSTVSIQAVDETGQ